MNSSSQSALFVPNLLKLPSAPRTPRAPPTPFCPTRHPAPLAPAPFSTSAPPVLPAPPRVTPIATLTPKAPTSPPVAVSLPLPFPLPSPPPTALAASASDALASAPSSTSSQSPSPSPSMATVTVSAVPPVTSVANDVEEPHVVRRGRKHTDEARRKIGSANRGNVPWNKGKTHSEETRRKISENTRNAMRRPEVREILKQRASGRKHTEETKLKIRRTSRLHRGSTQLRRKPKGPVPFMFSPETVQQINSEIDKDVQQIFVEGKPSPNYSFTMKKPMAESTKQKLRDRIKQLWKDPEYREKVSSGVAARMKKAREERGIFDDDDDSGDNGHSRKRSPKTLSAPKKRGRPARQRKTESKIVNRVDDDEDGDLEYLDDEEEEEFEDEGREIFLAPNELSGLTKEDLGLVGSHAAGPVSGFGDLTRSTLEGMVDMVAPVSFPREELGADMDDSQVALQHSDLNGGENAGTSQGSVALNEGPLLENGRKNGRVITTADDLSDQLERSDLMMNVDIASDEPMAATVPVASGSGIATPSLSDMEIGLLEVPATEESLTDARNIGSPFDGIPPFVEVDEPLTAPAAPTSLDDLKLSSFEEDEDELFGSRMNSNVDF